MSVRVTSWVWQHSSASGTDLLLLLALADQADDQGKCWPSMDYLSKKVRVHEDTARRALKKLVKEGLVSRDLRDGRSSIYRVQMTTSAANPPADDPPADCDPLQDTGGSSATPPPRRSPPHPPANDPPITVKEPSRNRQEGAFGPPPSDDELPLPADWSITDRMRRFATEECPDVDIELENKQFVDHYRSTGDRRTDWIASWRKWMRSEQKKITERRTRLSQQSQPAPGQSAWDRRTTGAA